MHKSLLLPAAALLSLTGCTHTRVDRVELTSQDRFSIIQIDGSHSYLIDPRTESCFLRQNSGNFNFALVTVPCDKLKKNVPEASAFITWVPDGAEAPAAATP
ncbi:hypothetical protein ACLEPN_10120 [Myxococcus sp. 1LA]